MQKSKYKIPENLDNYVGIQYLEIFKIKKISKLHPNSVLNFQIYV